MHRLIIAAGLTLAAAAPAAAQDACGIKALPKAAPGSYAEYKLTGGEADGVLRIAYLGSEEKNGKSFQRLEMQTSGDRMSAQMGGPTTMQMLVPAWPFSPDQIGEMVVQPANRPAMRVPLEMFQMMQQRGGGRNPALAIERSCSTAKLVGEEKVTVAAGSFTAKHYRNDADAIDFWVSPELGGFGIVKTSGKGVSMELVGKGTGAKSSLTGDVMDMNGMMGGPRGAGRP